MATESFTFTVSNPAHIAEVIDGDGNVQNFQGGGLTAHPNPLARVCFQENADNGTTSGTLTVTAASRLGRRA